MKRRRSMRSKRLRPKNRWDDDVSNNLRKMKLHKRSERAQDRIEWKKIVEKAKTLHEL
jgi:hypothetical protein